MEQSPPQLGAGTRRVVGVALLAALAYLAVAALAGWDRVTAAFARIGWSSVGVMLGLSALNFALRALRWQAYVGHLGYQLPWGRNLRIYLAGFVLTVTPGKLGELMRGTLLKPHGVPYAASNALFLAERVSDLLAVLLLCALVFRGHPAALPLLALALVAVLGLAWGAHHEPLLGWLGRRGAAGHSRWAHAAAHVAGLMREFRRCFEWRILWPGLLLGFLAWGAQGLAFWWGTAALGGQIDWASACFIYGFALIAGVLSFLPGGLGGAEAAMIGLLVWQGVTADIAVAATLLMQLTALWFAVAVGAVAAWRLR